jgi:hypothetical protein
MNARPLFALLITAFVACGASARAQSPSSVEPAAVKAVIELYTSQGCSSCPPADELMRKLSTRTDIIALSLPVDYWDYLGWKDTFASSAYGERQRAYAQQRGDGLIYTPQMVVNGRTHVNGAKSADIEAAISSTSEAFSSRRVPVRIVADQDKLVIDVGAREGAAPSATIWLATVQRAAEVVVRKGENRGRTLTYANVVREIIPVGMWSGKAETIHLERQSIMRSGADACAVIVQKGKAGPILGAVWLPQL